jgi:hypothetical protein
MSVTRLAKGPVSAGSDRVNDICGRWVPAQTRNRPFGAAKNPWTQNRAETSRRKAFLGLS